MIEMAGKRFGRLIVLRDSKKRDKYKNIIWLCRCDCGNSKLAVASHLRSGNTKSCGCLNIENIYKHGDVTNNKKSRLYRIWGAIKDRCYNQKSLGYKYYGARGIRICKEWKDNYSTFKFWAILNGYRKELTIDRINHKGNYEPNNCQWLTNSENVKKQWRDIRNAK